jgi:hypothetical protein
MNEQYHQYFSEQDKKHKIVDLGTLKKDLGGNFSPLNQGSRMNEMR